MLERNKKAERVWADMGWECLDLCCCSGPKEYHIAYGSKLKLFWFKNLTSWVNWQITIRSLLILVWSLEGATIRKRECVQVIKSQWFTFQCILWPVQRHSQWKSTIQLSDIQWKSRFVMAGIFQKDWGGVLLNTPHPRKWVVSAEACAQKCLHQKKHCSNISICASVSDSPVTHSVTKHTRLLGESIYQCISHPKSKCSRLLCEFQALSALFC